MKRFLLFLASIAMVLSIAGCGGKGSPAAAPMDVSVIAGDSALMVTWTMQPGVDYWVFTGQGTGVTHRIAVPCPLARP